MWSAEKTGKQVSNGQVFVWVRFTRKDTGEFFEPEPYRSTSPAAGWPDDAINARLKELDAIDIDADGIALGIPEPSKPIEPPSQKELDRVTWLETLKAYRVIKAEVEGGFTKDATQSDVDAAYALVKEGYRPEYGDLLL